MTLALLCSFGTGLGLIGLVAGVRHRRPSLQTIFETLDKDTDWQQRDGNPSPQWRFDRSLGARLKVVIEERSWIRKRLEPSLRLVDITPETLCAQAVLGGAVGFLLPIACWGIVTAGHLHVSVFLPLWVGLAFAASGAALPFVVLSGEAKRKRRAARRVVGSFLDLVVLCLAGGMGIEGALHAASQVGEDDVSIRLRTALLLARDSGTTPWDALAQVGADYGLSELDELAAAVGLAGSQGARIRSTLAAKAASIRRHELSDSEAEANAITERLFLPGVFLLVGFLLFIGYPAVARIVGGF